VFIGCVVIYSSLFSIGNFVYGENMTGAILGTIAAVGTVILFKLFAKLRTDL
jgi:hypothetical protein